MAGGEPGRRDVARVLFRLGHQLGHEGKPVLELPDRVTVEDGAGQHPPLALRHCVNVCAGRGGGDSPVELVAHMVEDGGHQLLLGPEVAVHQAVVDPGARGHLPDGGGGRALLREEVGGGVEHRRHDVGPP